MDRILIKDLSARCLIGINEEERREKQEVLINLVIYADLSQAGQSDRFEDTVDYRSLKKRILVLVEDSKFYLIEALAEAISRLCLEHALIERVEVRVDKPGALRFARSVAVEIFRTRRS